MSVDFLKCKIRPFLLFTELCFLQQSPTRCLTLHVHQMVAYKRFSWKVVVFSQWDAFGVSTCHKICCGLMSIRKHLLSNDLSPQDQSFWLLKLHVLGCFSSPFIWPFQLYKTAVMTDSEHCLQTAMVVPDQMWVRQKDIPVGGTLGVLDSFWGMFA